MWPWRSNGTRAASLPEFWQILTPNWRTKLAGGTSYWVCFATLQALSQSPSSIQLDPFAEHLSSRATRWQSMFHMPGSTGRDECYQRWVTYEGAKAFAFVNDPYRELDKIIAKIMAERADFILLAPSWSRPRVATIKSRLPVVLSSVCRPHDRKPVSRGLFRARVSRQPRAATTASGY